MASPKTMTEQKKKLLGLLSDPAYRPMRIRDIYLLLGVPKEKRPEIQETLDILVAEGKVSVSKRGKISLSEEEVISGIFTGNPRGFGFVAVPGREQDYYISPDHTRGALHGDEVEIKILRDEPRGGRTEAKVLRIIARANEHVVGYFKKSRGTAFVLPDNPRITSDIFIPKGKENGASSGMKVMVRVTGFPEEPGLSPEGEVEEILGLAEDPGVDILSVIRAMDLPEEFPEEVLRETMEIPDRVSRSDTEKRLDLRELFTVTIDGEDSRDLDDAVSVARTDGGYRLGVHIADVSHYVKEGSALDKEAFRRGTSVYFPDRVLPMLPPKLSNGICSLNEGEERLTLSCLMDIDEKGNITSHEIGESVIRTKHRMTYTEVNAILEDPEGETALRYADAKPLFFLMKEAAGVLRQKRLNRGSIDFDFPECKIILDERGRAADIRPYLRKEAERIIEDFMLAANETVAEEYYWRQLPFLYRVHEKPDEAKMKRLATFVANFGLIMRTPGGKTHPKEIQKLLDTIAGTEQEALLSRLVLRSMKQAKYSPVCSGHFGLAADYYTHFTSPIRRYPDLQIHRIIKECLTGKMGNDRIAHYERILPEAALQTSRLERRADEAERECAKLKKVQYMEQFIGDTFEGVISQVTQLGFYVELSNTVEGLVHVTALADDYYQFDEERCELVGEMSSRKYSLGQPIRVTVTGCDRVAKTVDFIPAGTGRKADRKASGRRG